MFNQILVAIDHSQRSEAVFEEALTLAQTTQARLMLLHVLSAEEDGSPQASILPAPTYYPMLSNTLLEAHSQQWQEYENKGLELLRSLTERATTAGISTEFTQQLGSPGQSICNLAHSWKADLIILGRRGRSGLHELLMGSVSNYVTHHAPCSVLVVQGRAPSASEPSSNPATVTV